MQSWLQCLVDNLLSHKDNASAVKHDDGSEADSRAKAQEQPGYNTFS